LETKQPFTISEMAADCCVLITLERIMGLIIAHISEQLDLQSSWQTYCCPNLPQEASSPWFVS